MTKNRATPKLRCDRRRPGSEPDVAWPNTAVWNSTMLTTASARTPSIIAKRGCRGGGATASGTVTGSFMATGSGNVTGGLATRAAVSLRLRAADAADRVLGRRSELTPPRRLQQLVGDSDFEQTGEEFGSLMDDLGVLHPSSRVSTSGAERTDCAGVAPRLRPPGSYDGFDVMAEAIDWCARHYGGTSIRSASSTPTFTTRCTTPAEPSPPPSTGSRTPTNRSIGVATFGVHTPSC